MTMRAAFGALALAFCAALALSPAGAQTQRDIEISQDADYFGFDLRTERDVTLDQCTAVCLADPGCRAFTFNARVGWCFLKSDWQTLNPFPGAVAGRVVDRSAEPDLGAPPALSFVPRHIADEARTFADGIEEEDSDGDAGVFGRVSAAEAARAAGNGLAALDAYRSALGLDPDNAGLWIALARTASSMQGDLGDNYGRVTQAATGAALEAYRLSRGTGERADALAALAEGFAFRRMPRPALESYKASLALTNAPAVQAAFEALRAREGFRVVGNTVESDSLEPRVCVQFSEDLVKSGVNYADFVTVDGRAPAGVEAKERQLCAEGLSHGQRYRVTVRSGLPSTVGETLGSPVALEVYVRDRAASIRFTGENFVLPAQMRRGIPIVSVNAETAMLEVYRVGERALAAMVTGGGFLRQLDGYGVERLTSELGQPVWKGEIDIARELNREVVTSFPVDEALPQRTPGVYVLVARPKAGGEDYWQNRATQWFVVSDIGLATYAGTDNLTVFARSLATASPMPSAELTLIAKNNEILGTATADAEGRATFSAGLMRGAEGMAPAAITARLGDDFVFLDMTRAGFDLSDRGVAGRAAPGPVDVFAWTERGIYRAGETVHAAALARDGLAAAVEGLPLTFVFSRPDGREDRRLISDGAALGGHALELPLPANAMRGTWQMRIFTDPKAEPVATSSFLVEDFVPDRIEFDLTADAEELRLGETVEVAVAGRFLYGAPAAGLELEGEIALRTTRERANLPGYVFGLDDEEDQEATRIELDNLPVTDEDGEALVPVTVDQAPSTTRPLRAEVTLRMRENGGRAVERRLGLAVAPEGPMIGIRPEFSGGQVPEGGTAGFRVIAVGEDGQRIDLPGLDWTLYRIERNYQWYRVDNAWNYEPVSYTRQVANGRVDARAGAEATLSQAVEWGRYRLEVTSRDASGPATSIEFEAGYFVEATSTETPDGLEIALDKDRYAPGETARLQISPRFAGELLVAVGTDRLLATHRASVPEGGATIDIPVSGEWGAGAYVTAALYRPGEAQESRMPMRAIGVKWLAVEPEGRKLSVSLETPQQISPRGALAVPVRLAGLAPDEEAYVTVAAVDVGILNLTAYQPPAPSGWYFGQRRMSLELRDIYGRLIDGSLGAAGRIRTGGDGGQMAMQGSPPTERLVAFFSGPVRVDADGRAEVAFDIPQFNGTVRVMAVAWSAKGVGEATRDVVVRDPVVVTASLPRFLAPGDRTELHLDIANTDGPGGDYAVTVETTGGLRAAPGDDAARLALGTGERKSLTVPVTAISSGAGGLVVRVAHADGLAVEQRLSLPVRPATLPVATRQVVSLAPGASLRIDQGLFQGSLLEGASVSVGVSANAALDVASLVMALDRYPYGCAEQTVSRALPLLYVSQLSELSGLEPDPEIGPRIDDAIARVFAYQSWSGSFGLWAPGSGDLWLDAYVTDFLTRAREEGFAVPEEGFSQALDNLRNALAYDVDVTVNGPQIAYALYVLARNGRASIGDLRYYADTQIDRFATPLARAQVGAALALYGDRQRAERAFASALGLVQTQAPNLARSDYGSKLRDGAAILALAAEMRPAPGQLPEMVRAVAASDAPGRQQSTQEQAWLVLAARALAGGNAAIALDVEGNAHRGAFSRRLEGGEVIGNPLTVANRGADPVEAVVTAIAAPADPLPAGGDGFTIDRTYYGLDGTPMNVSEAAQNERFVVVLTMTEKNAWPSRVLVTDLLPAGLVIDNPRIVGSAELGEFDWLGEVEAAHSEFRDDRFVAAFDRTADSAREFRLAYVVRAVTPGTYAHPAAQVEDMYRPQFSARTAAGAMEIVAAP